MTSLATRNCWKRVTWRGEGDVVLGLRNGGNLVRSSQQVHRNRKKEWVLKRPATAMVVDFTLTDKALPLPDWSLAKVPPINTGDRSEFQMMAVKYEFLSGEEAKFIFAPGNSWKHLDARRKEQKFESSKEVMKFLRNLKSEVRPAGISEFIQTFQLLFDGVNGKPIIRING